MILPRRGLSLMFEAKDIEDLLYYVLFNNIKLYLPYYPRVRREMIETYKRMMNPDHIERTKA